MTPFFHTWTEVSRVLGIGVLAYCALLVLLLASGKRTLSKLNSFDFVITVALGSTLATALLSTDVSLAEGVAAFAILIGLQFATETEILAAIRSHGYSALDQVTAVVMETDASLSVLGQTAETAPDRLPAVERGGVRLG